MLLIAVSRAPEAVTAFAAVVTDVPLIVNDAAVALTVVKLVTIVAFVAAIPTWKFWLNVPSINAVPLNVVAVTVEPISPKVADILYQ